MTPAERRYQEGLAVAASLRAGATPVPTGREQASRGRAKPVTDAWLQLTECSEANRPPRDAAERRRLEAVGAFDLAPEGKDGCRLRLRAPGGRLRAWQLRALAALTQEHGGGFIEIGARGEVELPLVPWREAAAALTRARSAGLTGRGTGGGGIVNVVAGPLAGLDGEEWLDVGRLVEGLDALGTECPEFSAESRGNDMPRALQIGVDGGGRGWPAGVAQDAVFRAGAGGKFRLLVSSGDGGTGMTDVGGGVPAALALRTGAALARAFRQSGGAAWEVGDLAATLNEALGIRLGREGAASVEVATEERALGPGVYPHQAKGTSFLVAGGPADGRWRSRTLLALAALAEADGAGEVRSVRAFSPAGVLVPGVADGRVEAAARALTEAGFALVAPV